MLVSSSGSLNRYFSQGLTTALSGMRDAQVRMNVAAHNIANANTSNFSPNRVNSHAHPAGGVVPVIESTDVIGTSYVEEGVSMLLAKTQFNASAYAAGVFGDTSKTLMSMLG